MTQKRRTREQLSQEAGAVARYVRMRRLQLGHTQAEFAQRIGVGLRFLRELEQGKQSLRMDKVNQVLRYLGAELGPVPLSKTSS